MSFLCQGEDGEVGLQGMIGKEGPKVRAVYSSLWLSGGAVSDKYHLEKSLAFDIDPTFSHSYRESLIKQKML